MSNIKILEKYLWVYKITGDKIGRVYSANWRYKEDTQTVSRRT
jgi:hypothetical protein